MKATHFSINLLVSCFGFLGSTLKNHLALTIKERSRKTYMFLKNKARLLLFISSGMAVHSTFMINYPKDNKEKTFVLK